MDIEKRAQLGNGCHATLTSQGGLTMESQRSFAAYKITDKMRERIHLPLLPLILYKTELLGGRSRKYLRSVADAISYRMRTIVREKAIPHAWAEPRAMLVLVIASSRSSTTAPRVQRSMSAKRIWSFLIWITPPSFSASSKGKCCCMAG